MTTITSATLTGPTADASVDATTLLFRRMADRGDGKGGAADGIVSDTEAKTFVTEVENLGLFHIKTTKNNSLDTHEQIGALEFEMRRLEGLGQTQAPTYQTLSSQVASLIQGLAQYDTATIERAYKAKAGTTTLPAGKLVGQYENIYFVSKNAATAADAQAFTKNFIAEASKTRTGRYILELMVKQDNGEPVIYTLDDSTGPHVDSECTSHTAITLYYKDHSVSDPYTMGIHEMSHSTGFYWQGDLTPAKIYASLYDVDTNENGKADRDEFETVIRAKRPQKHDPLVPKPTDRVGTKSSDLGTFSNFDNEKHPIGRSYTEHVATFFEQAFRLDRGMPVSRAIYDIYEKPEKFPNDPKNKIPISDQDSGY